MTMDLGFSSFMLKPPPRLQQKGLLIGSLLCVIYNVFVYCTFAGGVYYDELQFTLVSKTFRTHSPLAYVKI